MILKSSPSWSLIVMTWGNRTVLEEEHGTAVKSEEAD